jgi:hypothetical protein
LFARIVLVAAIAWRQRPPWPNVRGAAGASTHGIRPRAIATGRDGSVLVVGDRGPIYSQRFPYDATVADAPTR